MMSFQKKSFLLVPILLLVATTAFAEWYDDYDAGVKAARAGQWETVIQKMNAALAGNPNENARARTYGNIFIKYHPNYYLGLAYLRMGGRRNLEQALEYFGKATGAGDFNQGSAGTLSSEADRALNSILESLAGARQRAETAISEAMNKMSAAQGVNAPQLAQADFNKGAGLLRDANAAKSSADSTQAWQAIEDKARQAGSSFDQSLLNAQLAATRPVPSTPTPIPQTPDPNPPPKVVVEPTRPTTSGTPRDTRPSPPSTTPSQGGSSPSAPRPEVIRPVRERLKEALGHYFDGNFGQSAIQLTAITQTESNNPMIWAFLGASYYYDYYLGGESNAGLLQQATAAAQRAKRIDPGLDLDSAYFSSRFRAFFAQVSAGG